MNLHINFGVVIMKKLFVLVADREDGSYSPQYTFNENWIKQQKEKYKNGDLEWPSLGVDGDGFHYDTLTVPSECTLESMGIFRDCAE